MGDIDEMPPLEIPPDIMQTARHICFVLGIAGSKEDAHSTDVEIIARSLLGERERCAMIAEIEGVHPETDTHAEWLRHGKRIARVIRKGAW